MAANSFRQQGRRNTIIPVKNLKATCALLLAICGATAEANARAQLAVVGDGGPGPVRAQHLTAELVALSPAISPGGTQQVGLLLTLDKHWHVYWINPGDSGEPPKITWTLPTGITAEPMQFPIPKRLPLGPLMDFGYEDEVAFPVTIAAASTMKPGPVHLDAHVSWLVCAQVCIPGKAHMGINLMVQPATPGLAQTPLSGALGRAMTLLPKPLPAGANFTIVGGAQQFAFTLIDGKRESDAEFYPYPTEAAAKGVQPPNVIVNAAVQKIEPQRDGVLVTVQRSPDVATLPATMHGIVKLSDNEAYEVTAPVVAGEVVAANNGSVFSTAVISAIGLAFVGGILLNLMPCVFPVLFLKGLSLMQSSSQSRAHQRRHGLMYAAGILVSFWGIVAALLVLRATGTHVGWGFQLQSPAFIALLASLIFMLALSLAGQFEIGLSLTSVGGELAQKQGYAGSFFTGVLATIVATPCAAPFMGAAIGFALTQPAGTVFAVFTSLALGLAAPYLLLSWQPAWVRLLPRPGAWMEVFKHITAAIFFATAIWLAWVYGQLYAAGDGVNQVALLLSCFLLLAIAGWTLGRWPTKWGSTIAAVVLIALGLAIPLSQTRGVGQTGAETSVVQQNAGQTSMSASNAIAALVWQTYSEQALDAARRAGHPVFIDFTAAWCLSCQVNERLVLKSADVESALLKSGVVTMKADWTNSDPAITAKLASLGRASVPTYVVYPAAAGSAPDVLPEALTKGIVLAAIERDTK